MPALQLQLQPLNTCQGKPKSLHFCSTLNLKNCTSMLAATATATSQHLPRQTHKPPLLLNTAPRSLCAAEPCHSGLSLRRGRQHCCLCQPDHHLLAHCWRLLLLLLAHCWRLLLLLPAAPCTPPCAARASGFSGTACSSTGPCDKPSRPSRSPSRAAARCCCPG